MENGTCEICFFPYYERIKNFISTKKIDTNKSGHTLFIFEFEFSRTENKLEGIKISRYEGSYITSSFASLLLKLLDYSGCPSDKKLEDLNNKDRTKLNEILKNLKEINEKEEKFLFLIRTKEDRLHIAESKHKEEVNNNINQENQTNLKYFIEKNVLCVPLLDFKDFENFKDFKNELENLYENYKNSKTSLSLDNLMELTNSIAKNLKKLLRIEFFEGSRKNQYNFMLELQKFYSTRLFVKYLLFMWLLFKNKKLDIFLLLFIISALNFLVYAKERIQKQEIINFEERYSTITNKLNEKNDKIREEFLYMLMRCISYLITKEAINMNLIGFKEPWREIFFTLYIYYLLIDDTKKEFYKFGKAFQEFFNKKEKKEEAVKIFMCGRWYKDLKEKGVEVKDFKSEEYEDLRGAKNYFRKKINDKFYNFINLINNLNFKTFKECLDNFKKLEGFMEDDYDDVDIEKLFSSLKSKLITNLEKEMQQNRKN